MHRGLKVKKVSSERAWVVMNVGEVDASKIEGMSSRRLQIPSH